MDATEIIIPSEISQKEKDKYHMISLICGILNMAQMNLSTKQDTDIENRLVVAMGREGVEGKDWEFGINKCKLVHTGWINNKVLLYSTGNYIQFSGINHNGKEYFFKCMYVCV